MTFTGTGEVSTTTTIAFGGGSADFLTVRPPFGQPPASGRRWARAPVARRGPSPDPGPGATGPREPPRACRTDAGVGDVFGVDAECDDWDLAWLGTFDLPAGCSAAFYPGDGTKDGMRC